MVIKIKNRNFESYLLSQTIRIFLKPNKIKLCGRARTIPSPRPPNSPCKQCNQPMQSMEQPY